MAVNYANLPDYLRNLIRLQPQARPNTLQELARRRTTNAPRKGIIHAGDRVGVTKTIRANLRTGEEGSRNENPNLDTLLTRLKFVTRIRGQGRSHWTVRMLRDHWQGKTAHFIRADLERMCRNRRATQTIHYWNKNSGVPYRVPVINTFKASAIANAVLINSTGPIYTNLRNRIREAMALVRQNNTAAGQPVFDPHHPHPPDDDDEDDNPPPPNQPHQPAPPPPPHAPLHPPHPPPHLPHPPHPLHNAPPHNPAPHPPDDDHPNDLPDQDEPLPFPDEEEKQEPPNRRRRLLHPDTGVNRHYNNMVRNLNRLIRDNPNDREFQDRFDDITYRYTQNIRGVPGRPTKPAYKRWLMESYSNVPRIQPRIHGLGKLK